MVLGARFFDRIGKGIRDAPRDALVADLTPENARGVAYGLRQALDTVGAFVGPLIALALMVATGNQFRLVFWIAVAPAFIAVALVAFGVQEPKPSRPTAQMRLLFRRTDLARLHRRYWFVVALAAVLSLARFSQASLLLRAENVGLAVPFIPSVVLVMNIVYASSAYPFGALSDKVARLTLLAFGIVFLIAANIVLAGAQNILAVFFGAVLWGLHMGASEGLLSALVADSCPEDLRGTAFGIFNLASGTALLLASIAAGWLWAALGPSSTFIAGAIFAGLSLMGIATWAPRKKSLTVSHADPWLYEEHLRRESANRCVVNATGENINRNKLARLGSGFFRFRPPDCRERTRWRRIDNRWNSWHLARRGIPDCSMPALEVLRSNSGRDFR